MKECPVSGYCGGCQYQGISYEEQLRMKQESIEKLLSSFHHVEPVIGCRESLFYRNKMQISFGYDENHRVISGYYLEKSHMIISVDECMICEKGLNRILSSVRKLVSKYHISVFDEKTLKGWLRHVLIRCSDSGEYMIVLVTGYPEYSKKDLMIKELLKSHKEIRTIVQNINRNRSSAVLGDRDIVLYGKGYITDHICGLNFRISASSFYQVNRIQTEILYEEAIKAAGFKGDEVLIDAYCGTGTIGLCAAGRVKQLIGVELNRSAVKDALINAKINGIENAQFICEDAGKHMEKLSRNRTHVDTVIMDPPRTGSNPRFLSSMIALRPQRVVYVSCNPVTLKRDLKQLNDIYQVESIQPVDMFPYTRHVEVVTSLKLAEERKGKK